MANEVGGKRENRVLKVSLECVHVTHEEEECANVACVPERLRLGWVLSEQEETCTPGRAWRDRSSYFAVGLRRALEDDRFH